MKKDSHINKSQMKISFMSAVVSDCAYIEGCLVKGFVKEQYSSVINHQGPSHVIFTHVKCSLPIKLQVAQLTQWLGLLMCSPSYQPIWYLAGIIVPKAKKPEAQPNAVHILVLRR